VKLYPLRMIYEIFGLILEAITIFHAEFFQYLGPAKLPGRDTGCKTFPITYFRGFIDKKEKWIFSALLKLIEPQARKGRKLAKIRSLLIKLDIKALFQHGRGFKDAERDNPRIFGRRFVFKHYGYTKTNTPRMAPFLRLDQEI